MKKVLLVTYYWPPSGGASIQRPVKLVKYLRQYGVEPVVLTVKPEQASYGVLDPSFEREIPEGIQVVRTDTTEPFQWYLRVTGKSQIPMAGFSNESNPGLLQKLSRFVRGNFFIPDARVGWVKHALKAALQLIDEHGIDTVLTTSPPHSLQLLGLELKKLRKIKWVADLNDPWTDIYYYPQMYHTPLARRKDAAYEKAVLEQADHLVTVSQDFRRIFLEKSPLIQEAKFSVIPNGFDQDDFQQEAIPPADKWRVTYTGTLADSYRTEVFFEALSKLVSTEQVPLELCFYGIVAAGVQEQIGKLGLNPYVVYHPPVSHSQVVMEMQRSHVLFLAVPNVANNKGICPGKLFEYLAARRRVVCIGPPDGDTARILQECEAGETFSPEQGIPLTAHLRSLLEQYRTGVNPVLPGTEQIYQYERSHIAGAMAAVLNS